MSTIACEFVLGLIKIKFPSSEKEYSFIIGELTKTLLEKECQYSYFSNDYYAFTIHDQLELKKVGPILSPYYINHGLSSTD